MTAALMPAAARDGAATTPGPAPRSHAPAPQPPTADILDRAADLVAERWAQDTACDTRGGVCLEYAVFLVAHRAGLPTEQIDHIVDTITARLGQAARDWNDTPGRTQHEVVALLRDCAAQARRA